MYLLDTNICIFMLRGSSVSVSAKVESLDPSLFFLSVMTVHELYYGVEKRNMGEGHRIRLAQFLSPFTILPFDSEDAIAAAKIRTFLEKKGTPIGPYDIQIAAQGMTRGFTVVTHNFGEFNRIPGLKVEDWV